MVSRACSTRVVTSTPWYRAMSGKPSIVLRFRSIRRSVCASTHHMSRLDGIGNGSWRWRRRGWSTSTPTITADNTTIDNLVADLNAALLEGPRGREFLTRTPMRRFGRLDELVGAAVYLASDASSFVTGQFMVVDGGFLASGVNQ